MSRPRLPALLAAILAALLLGVGPIAPAAAATPAPVSDCQAHHGELTRAYSVAQLQAALKVLPPGVQEYTACYSAIQSALSADTGTSNLNPSGTANSSGGGSGTTVIVVIVLVVLLLGAGAALWAYRRGRAMDTGR